MSQGGLIAGALLLAWIMYLAINQRLGAYLAVVTGGAASTPITTTAVGVPTGVGVTPGPQAPGTIGTDPNFQPSILAPGSFFDTRAPLNPPT
jgi:hypothetical protein